MKALEKAIHMLGSNDEGLQILGIAAFVHNADNWVDYRTFMSDKTYKKIELKTRINLRKALVLKLGKRDSEGKLIKKYRI